MMGLFGRRKKNVQREQVEFPVAAGSGGAEAMPVAKGGGEGTSLVLFGNIEKVFDLEDIVSASAELLGKGIFGTCFKANLEIGPVVVKRLKNVEVSDTKFIEMFDAFGKLNHENLLPIKAYHCSNTKKFLVYDYMPMGSLSDLLQRNRGKSLFNWESRFGIALGVARAIAYLHSTTFHGNIKTSNILLTTSLEARVSDYLPNKQMCTTDSGSYFSSHIVSQTNEVKVFQKDDVYDFGIVLLELLTGKTRFFLNEFVPENVSLRRWILSVVEGELTSPVFELDLLQYENVEEDLVRMLRIAIDCTSHDPHSRPSIAQVRNQMEKLCRA